MDSIVPSLFTVSEHDPAAFQRQAFLLCDRWIAAKGHWPRMIYLQGDNHLSPALGRGSGADRLGPELLAFLTASGVFR